MILNLQTDSATVIEKETFMSSELLPLRLLIRINLKIQLRRKRVRMIRRNTWLCPQMVLSISLMEKQVSWLFLSGKGRWDCTRKLRELDFLKNIPCGKHFRLGKLIFESNKFKIRVHFYQISFSYLTINWVDHWWTLEKLLSGSEKARWSS